MKLLLSVFAFFLISPIYSQNLFPERQTACETKSFILENDTILAEYQSNEALLFDFLKKLETRYLKKVKGELLIQVLIDSTGHPCCISLRNQTNITTKRLGVVAAVNSMTGWKALKQQKNSGNICAVIKLIFTDRKFVAMRLGYNIKSKFSVLYSTELKRSILKD